MELFNDDGEKFGGERVLKAMKDAKALDVLTICCRWVSADKTEVAKCKVWWGDDWSKFRQLQSRLLQPIRFQHIGLTARTSLISILKLITLRDLREALESLEEEISVLRETITPGSKTPHEKGKYDDVDDVGRLERLVKARGRTKSSLEARAGWAGLDQAREARGPVSNE